MTAVIPFTFEDSEFRVITHDGDPWFVLADVCRALGLSDNKGSFSHHATKLDNDEKRTIPREAVFGTPRSNMGVAAEKFFDQNNANVVWADPSVWIVSESGLYTIILRCRGAATSGTIAHRFRKWVTAEVLPAIRKTGRYEAAPKRQETAGRDAMITIPVSEYMALSQQLIRLQREDIAYKVHKRRDDHLEKANSLVNMLFQETALTDEQIAQALVDYAGGYMPEWVAWKRRLWTEAPVS